MLHRATIEILEEMPVKPVVPMALRNEPFTIAEANSMGVSRDRLRGASFRRLGSGLYRWARLKEGPLVTLGAMAKRMPVGAAFLGHTAAWLHGLDVAPCAPIEITIPGPTRGHRAGASVKRAALDTDQIVIRRGLPTTSALRKPLPTSPGEIRSPRASWLPISSCMSELVTLDELRRYVAEHPRAKGIVRVRPVVDLAEPKAESAMETRLRLLLVLAGLPEAGRCSRSLVDHRGRLLSRPDLFYRPPKVGNRV